MKLLKILKYTTLSLAFFLFTSACSLDLKYILGQYPNGWTDTDKLGYFLANEEEMDEAESEEYKEAHSLHSILRTMSDRTLAYFNGDYEELLFMLAFAENLLSDCKTRDEVAKLIQEIVNNHKQPDQPFNKFLGESLWNLQLKKMQDFKSKKEKGEYTPDYRIMYLASLCSKNMRQYDEWIRNIMIPKMKEYGFERCIPDSIRRY